MSGPVVEIPVVGIKLSKSFLEQERDTIRERLIEAYQAMRKSTSSANPQGETPLRSDLFAINECLHLAMSILSLGSDHDELRAALGRLGKTLGRQEKDPMTMTAATAATLYYLLTCEREQAPPNPAFDYIHQRFDGINWMLDKDAMAKLGIAALKEGRAGG